jgi:hypothetical protein
MVARKRARKSNSRKAAKKTRPAKKTSNAKARKSPTAKARKSRAKASKKAAESNKAMRLTFSYDGDDVKLLSQQRTEMIVPASDAVKGYGTHKGFWAELRSGSDKILYRTVMHNPTKNDAEVFPESPGEVISRVPAPKRKGVFTVLLPDTDKGQQVILCRSTPATKGPTKGIRALASKPAEELLRLKLNKKLKKK